jgi:8-amino-7-oxononanoate synthase
MEMDAVLRRESDRRTANSLQRNLKNFDPQHGVEALRDGASLVNFASNDYLGLSQHPKLKAAVHAATDRYGSGAGASRLICGSLPVHRELEETIAAFKRTERALSFSTGYAAAIGTIASLVGKNDVIVIDKLVHASLVDGARLSGAKLRIFRHNDLENLQSILQWTRQWRTSHPGARILVVTESVFSMDGDCAPLREIVDLKKKHDAWLMVDEAHALGILGPGRRGLADELALGSDIEVQMGTLGKAAGAAGGFIAGSAPLIDHLINSARSFIFSTAPTPATAAAARAGLEIIASDEGERLRAQLLANIRTFTSARTNIPILPLMIGDEARAVAASEKLLAAGFLVPAIRYPTVARCKARLRITLSAAHIPDQISALKKQLPQFTASV